MTEPARPAGDGGRTRLLVAFSHPDDEVGAAGAIGAERAAGHDVTLLWLTRGEMTEALGPLDTEEIARRREAQGRRVAQMLDCEARFLDFEDTRVEATRDAARQLAHVLAEIRPDGLLTWGDAWRHGPRHPDHQATGRIVRDAVTLARIARVVSPTPPHRAPVPVFTMRGAHSQVTPVAVDVSAHRDVVLEVGAFYRSRVGWPPEGWLERRLAECGARWGVAAAEEYEAWETPGGLAASLLSQPAR